jgi:hypothetical protein
MYAMIEGGLGLIKVSNIDVSMLYVADVIGTQVIFSGAALPVSPDATVLSFSGDGFIYAEGNLLYRYSFLSRQSLPMDRVFGSNAVFGRAKDFKNFSISEGNNTVVYNASANAFTPAFEAQTLQFNNINSDYFTDGSYYYRFVGRDIEIIEADEYYSVNPEKFSQYTIDTIAPSGVSITEG